MKKLISMTDFVLLGWNDNQINIRYAKFLKQPLALWMFVPCELVGNDFANWQPMQEVIYSDQVHIYLNYEEKKDYLKRCKEHSKAKEQCLFVWQDGFDYKGICEMFTDLEDIIHFEFELTPLADKLLEAGI